MKFVENKAEIIIKDGIIVDVINRDDATIITDISSGSPVSDIYKSLNSIPAFIDSHIHLFGLGMKIETLSLYDCFSMEECIEKAVKYNRMFRGEWLVGIGWNESNWDSKCLPDRHILDAFFPNTPVYLIKSDGHSVWCNTIALEIAGISCQSTMLNRDIATDSLGHATGIVENSVKEMIYSYIPNYTLTQEKQILLSAQERILKYGISAICDMDTELSSYKALLELDNEKKLVLDIYSYLNPHNYHIAKNEQINESEHVKIKGIKLFADGTLGGRTAAMFEPYSDANDKCGELLINDDELLDNLKYADSEGIDLAIHCIGDKANDSVADAIIKARAVGVTNIIRIEHSQVIKPDTISKFVEAEIVASIQPTHCLSDAPELVIKRIGDERLQNAYRWNSLQTKGIKLICGSDAPVESEDPIIGMNALTERIPFNHSIIWNESEKISNTEALNTYTSNASEILNLNQGKIKNKYEADILLYNSNNCNLLGENSKNIQVFIKKGKIIKK